MELIRSIIISTCLMVVIVPTYMYLQINMCNNVPPATAAYYDSTPKEKPDTVEGGVYVYHRSGAVITLQSTKDDTFDPEHVKLTYQGPGQDFTTSIIIRLDDIDLFIRAIRDFRFEEPKRIRRKAFEENYESHNYHSNYRSSFNTYP